MTNRLEVVRDTQVVDQTTTKTESDAAAAAANAQIQVATKMLLMAVQGLAQRFVIELANLFTLLTGASAFYLWMISLPTIDTLKIVGLTIYSLFILAFNIYGRRK